MSSPVHHQTNVNLNPCWKNVFCHCLQPYASLVTTINWYFLTQDKCFHFIVNVNCFWIGVSTLFPASISLYHIVMNHCLRIRGLNVQNALFHHRKINFTQYYTNLCQNWFLKKFSSLTIFCGPIHARSFGNVQPFSKQSILLNTPVLHANFVIFTRLPLKWENEIPWPFPGFFRCV